MKNIKLYLYKWGITMSYCKRMSQFELLRIILMLFIIGGHILMWGDSLSNFKTNSFDYYLSNFLRSIFIISVNIFVIISGYFGINLKWKKLLKLESRILIYTYCALLVGIVIGIYNFSLLNDIKLLFPLITKQYWFITAYFILCILSPFINVFLDNITKRDLQKLIILLFIIFYCVATFCYAINADQIVPDAGYGIVNFISLYILGYYLKNYYNDKHNSFFYFCLFFISTILLFLANIFFTKVFGFYFDSFISYNSVFVLLGAINFFLMFKNMNLKYNKSINMISSRCLAVYIIHMNPILGKFIFENIFKVKFLTGFDLLLGVTIIPIIVYISSYIIDFIVDIIMYPIDKYIFKLK